MTQKNKFSTRNDRNRATFPWYYFPTNVGMNRDKWRKEPMMQFVQ